MNSLARSLGRLSARRPALTIVTWVVVLGAVLTTAEAFGGAFTDDLTAPGTQSERATRLLEEHFPAAAAGSAMAVFATPAGELTAHAATIATTIEDLRAVGHVTAVAHPLESGSLAPDGRTAVAEITFDVPAADLEAEVVTALESALAPAREAGLAAELGGEAIFLNNEPETSGAEAAGLVVALVLLVAAFGTVVAALLPIGLALVSVAVAIGGIALAANAMGMPADAPTIATMIGLGVGIDYALFVVARYREARRAGASDADALDTAMRTAGAAVVFAGGTVIVAMASLAVTRIGIVTAIGVAASLVVFVAVLAALTLLPATLTLLGDRVDRGRLVRRPAPDDPATSRWWRFAHRVSGRPWPYLVVSTTVLVLLAAPVVVMELGLPDAGTEPTTTTHRRAYDLLAEGFGPGVNGPLLVVVDVTRPAAAGDPVDTVAATLGGDDGIAMVSSPQPAPDGGLVVLQAVPTTGPSDPATAATIERIRAALPDDGVYVTGLTAVMVDLAAQLGETLPLFIGAVLVASFLLLLLVFRSILVPLKAAAMNLLSIGGAYGVIVAVFQWGWLNDLLGLEGPVPIVAFLPIFMFAVLFGLSMDYEVFLLSRVREEYRRTGDNAEAVARGLAATGRVITSAALIMISVFLGFVVNPSPILKMLGLGLATAIAIDATIVRMVVVPATMALLGHGNWWLPRWLDRILPHVAVEPDPERADAPART